MEIYCVIAMVLAAQHFGIQGAILTGHARHQWVSFPLIACCVRRHCLSVAVWWQVDIEIFRQQNSGEWSHLRDIGVLPSKERGSRVKKILAAIGIANYGAEILRLAAGSSAVTQVSLWFHVAHFWP